MADITMEVNGQPLSAYNARLIDYEVSPSQVDYQTVWRRLAPNPLLTSLQMTDKEIKVRCLVSGNNQTVALKRVSKLSRVLVQATIQFSDTDFLYDVRLNGVPGVTWFGDITTGSDNYRYLVEYNLYSSRAYTSRVSKTQSLSFTPSNREQVVSCTIDGNAPTPLEISLKLLGGASIDHLFYIGLGVEPSFEILNEYVIDKFAVLGVINGETVKIDSEKFKVYSNDVEHLSSFRGDFPFTDAPRDLDINVRIATMMGDESFIDASLTVAYKSRWF